MNALVDARWSSCAISRDSPPASWSSSSIRACPGDRQRGPADAGLSWASRANAWRPWREAAPHGVTRRVRGGEARSGHRTRGRGIPEAILSGSSIPSHYQPPARERGSAWPSLRASSPTTPAASTSTRARRRGPRSAWCCPSPVRHLRRAQPMTADPRLVADDERNLRELLVRELSRKGPCGGWSRRRRAAMERCATIRRRSHPRQKCRRWRASRAAAGPRCRSAAGHRDTGFRGVQRGGGDEAGRLRLPHKPARIEELDILIRQGRRRRTASSARTWCSATGSTRPPAGGIVTATPRWRS